MPLKSKRSRRKPAPRLYVGEWIRRLGRKPVEIAGIVGITESYLSEIISNKKENVGIGVLVAIVTELGISLDAITKPPPSPEQVSAVSGLDPEILRRLRQAAR